MSIVIGLAVIAAFFWIVDAVALRPWYTWLHLAELPGAMLVYLAGPGYRRQLRARLLRRREAAGEKLTVPVTPARQDFSLRSRARVGWSYLPGSQYCQCAGHEAARARAEHERYEAAQRAVDTAVAEVSASVASLVTELGQAAAVIARAEHERYEYAGRLTYHPGLPPGAAHLSSAGSVSFSYQPPGTISAGFILSGTISVSGEYPEICDAPGDA